MEKLNVNQLSEVLKDVRNSYRVLALYQERIFDTIKYIGNQYSFQFYAGHSKFGRGTANGKTATQNGMGWDWLGFYLYEFNMGDLDINNKVYSFKIIHQADTGFYDATEKILANNIEGFGDVKVSDSRLFFVLSENSNGCPIINILKQHLSSKTSKVIHKESWLAVPYDIIRFLNQDETNVVLNDFNNVCKTTFGIDLMSQVS
jgi:hypothetical protein